MLDDLDGDGYAEFAVSAQNLDASIGGTSFTHKTLQAYGLTNDGIYPTVLTWPGAANVTVTGKIDPDLDSSTSNTGEAHLWVYKQDRDNCSTAATSNAEWRPSGANDPRNTQLYP